MGIPLINPAIDLTGLTMQPLNTAAKSLKQGAAAEGESFHEVLASATSHKPDKIADSAKQFEGLLVGEMLKTARESSGGGWLSDEDDQDDQTGSMVMEMADQGFSQALAARGGLGIAKMVTKSLEHRNATAPSSDSETASPDPLSRDLKR
jgi:Rod binding domain-containing protein